MKESRVKIQKLALMTLVVLGAFACSKEEKEEKYSYDFSENGCKTEKHEFGSVPALCDGLQDESLNHSCASSMRRSMFEKSCPGRTWTVASSGSGSTGSTSSSAPSGNEGNSSEYELDMAHFTYMFSHNGCNTGRHAFSSLIEFCKGLNDNVLNHGCAKYMRAEVFGQNCSSDSIN
jgi:hypothetical protein